MGRRKSNVNISGRDRMRLFREREKIRREVNERIGILLQNAEIEAIQETKNDSQSKPGSKEVEVNLRRWSLENRISKRGLDSLLAILKLSGMRNLPKNHRTLQRTPTNVQINEVAGGCLWYNGLSKCLTKIFSAVDRDITLELNFNIDGLPIYKSSKLCFYPILASIHGMSMCIEFLSVLKSILIIKFVQGLPQIKPIVVSVWCGESKPNDLNEYLRSFVNEMECLLSNGLTINGNKIVISIRCFICDTPARAYIKGEFN